MQEKVNFSIWGLIFIFVSVQTVDFKNFRCQSDFCSSVECEPITECIGGKIVKNTSFCNCCEACVTFIGKDQSCEESVQSSFTEIQKSECQKGLQCINGTCILNTNEGSCLLKQHIRKMYRGIDTYAEDLWIPECDYEGNFKARQKKNRILCFAPSGERLFGQEERDTSENIECKCSLHVSEMKKINGNMFMTKPQEHCKSSGNFETLQCLCNLCYCANETTGKMIGHVVKKTFIDKLPCYDEKTSNKNYLTPCEEELQRARFILYQFSLKGIEVVSKDDPRCDPDGTYAAKQCDVDRCVCTDKRGMGIESYFIAIKEDPTLENMKCTCIRDMTTSYTQFLRFKCKDHDPIGNYNPLQCFDDKNCFCVDEDGGIISKKMLKANVDKAFCLRMLRKLEGFDDDDEVTATQNPIEVTTEELSTDDDDYSYYD